MYIIYQGHVNQDGKSSEPDNEGLGSNPRKQKWRRTVASLFLFASSKLSPSPCHPPLKKIKISLSSKHAKHAPLQLCLPFLPASRPLQPPKDSSFINNSLLSLPAILGLIKKKKKWIKKIENAPSWGGLQKHLQNFKEPLPKLVFLLHKCVISFQ